MGPDVFQGCFVVIADSKRYRRSGSGEPQPVADCLHDLPVAERAARFAELNRQLQLELPPALAGHIFLASIHAGRAVFVTTSSAWAARARLQQGELRHCLLTLGQQVRSLAVKVVQPERTPRAASGTKPLTHATAEHLRAAATSTSDPELRARFLALASLADDTPG